MLGVRRRVVWILTAVLFGGALALYVVVVPHPSAAQVAHAFAKTRQGRHMKSVRCKRVYGSWSCVAAGYDGSESIIPVEVGLDGWITATDEFGSDRSCCVR